MQKKKKNRNSCASIYSCRNYFKCSKTLGKIKSFVFLSSLYVHTWKVCLCFVRQLSKSIRLENRLCVSMHVGFVLLKSVWFLGKYCPLDRKMHLNVQKSSKPKPFEAVLGYFDPSWKNLFLTPIKKTYR